VAANERALDARREKLIESAGQVFAESASIAGMGGAARQKPEPRRRRRR